MAAPPLPNTPINTQQFTSLTTSTPTTPQSPTSQSLERSRIKLVLEINVDLLEEVAKLQVQGKGGATNPQHQAQLKALNKNDKMAADEFTQTMRRVQANLAWLAPRGNVSNVSNTAHKDALGPTHMTPPPHMPQLQSKYDKLREMCPGWLGNDLQQSGGVSRAPGVNGIS